MVILLGWPSKAGGSANNSIPSMPDSATEAIPEAPEKSDLVLLLQSLIYLSPSKSAAPQVQCSSKLSSHYFTELHPSILQPSQGSQAGSGHLATDIATLPLLDGHLIPSMHLDQTWKLSPVGHVWPHFPLVVFPSCVQ